MLLSKEVTNVEYHVLWVSESKQLFQKRKEKHRIIIGYNLQVSNTNIHVLNIRYKWKDMNINSFS